MTAKGFVKYDLTGQTFGRLRVLRYAGTPPRGNALWECVCECGNTATFPSGDIRRGNHKSCGCLLLAKIDATRFASMDTEEEAYWLGVMYTDGCLIETNRKVSLGLKDADRDHVIKFIRFLGSDRVPQISMMRGLRREGAEEKRHPFARFTVRSPQLFDNLVRQGCPPRKTWTIRPWDGPKHLLRHFWRGCVDGDGWLRPNSKRPKDGAAVGYCGNEAMIRGMSAYVDEQVGRPGVVEIRPNKGASASDEAKRFGYVTWRGNQQAYAVCRLLYGESSVSLDRKKAIADEIIARRPEPRFDWSTVSAADLLASHGRLGTWRSVAAAMGVTYDKLMGGLKHHGITFHRQRQRPSLTRPS